MKTVTSVRNEVHGLVEKLPERRLYALLDLLADDEDTMSKEELAAFEQCEKNWRENPGSFSDWEDVKREMGFATG